MKALQVGIAAIVPAMKVTVVTSAEVPQVGNGYLPLQRECLQ